MENNVAIQPTGFQYLWYYSGGLNILEELLNITIIIFLYFSGYTIKAAILNGVALVAFLYTAVLIILHIKGVIRRSKLAWHWIECISVLIIAILTVIFSTILISDLTKGYILTGLVGYLTATIYFLDTFDKYNLATTPVPKYAWTTPNMPDFN